MYGSEVLESTVISPIRTVKVSVHSWCRTLVIMVLTGSANLKFSMRAQVLFSVKAHNEIFVDAERRFYRNFIVCLPKKTAPECALRIYAAIDLRTMMTMVRHQPRTLTYDHDRSVQCFIPGRGCFYTVLVHYCTKEFKNRNSKSNPNSNSSFNPNVNPNPNSKSTPNPNNNLKKKRVNEQMSTPSALFVQCAVT